MKKSIFIALFIFSIQTVTASVTCAAQTPSIAYDIHNNKYLAVYVKESLPGSSDIVGRFVFETGGKDKDIDIAEMDGVNLINPALAYDNTHRNYLVVWENTGGTDSSIKGKFVTAGGRVGNVITISNLNDAVNPSRPAVAYDNVNDKFLVVWQDKRDGNFNIYGQLYNADTQAQIDSNFLISNSPGTDETNPALAYSTQYDIDTQADIDKALKLFLIVWNTEEENNTYSINGQLYDATPVTPAGSAFSISDSATADQDARPSVAYTVSNDIDTTNHEFIILWPDNRNGDTEIFGQIYSALVKAPLTNTNFIVSDTALTGEQANPAVSYDYVNSPRRYLAVWDNGDDIYGQYISIAGVRDGGTITVSDEVYQEHNPALSFSDNCKNFLIAFMKSNTTPDSLDIAIEGQCKKSVIGGDPSGGGGLNNGGGSSSSNSSGSSAGGGGCFISTVYPD
jgi:hypothetical protein